MKYEMIGNLGILPVECYYNKSSLANIILMQKLMRINGIKIEMNSTSERAINVTTKDGNLFKFIEAADRLYSYDMRKEPPKVVANNNFNN